VPWEISLGGKDLLSTVTIIDITRNGQIDPTNIGPVPNYSLIRQSTHALTIGYV